MLIIIIGTWVEETNRQEIDKGAFNLILDSRSEYRLDRDVLFIMHYAL